MVHFVGAGPGAADLITLRGMRLIREADCIIYAGSLVNPEILKERKAGAEVYDSARLTLDQVIALIVRAEERGWVTVRLHTGDPSLYGAIREQMDALEQRGIAFDVTPGVSSFTAAAAALNLEFTLPGVSQTLIISRMEGRTAVPERESIASLAAHGAGMAVFLSTGMTGKLAEALISGGYTESTPAAIVYKASWKEERAYRCTVGTLQETAEKNGIRKTGMILVGEFVAQRNYELSRLYDPDFSTEYRQGRMNQAATDGDRTARASVDGGRINLAAAGQNPTSRNVEEQSTVGQDLTSRNAAALRRVCEVTVVGMGPGAEAEMTVEAIEALERAEVIVGYPVYLRQLGARFQGKRFLSTPMRAETERCRLAFAEAQKGCRTVMLCSGDAGVYGMASLMLEVRKDFPDCAVRVVPGVTAALSGGARLGAPLGTDFSVISLSDLLTPWEKIEARLRAAAAADMNIVIYNPASKKRADYLRRACDILLEYLPEERICGYVRQIGREGEEQEILTLRALRDAKADMFTTVFIGSAATERIGGFMVTRRGYRDIR